MPQSPVPKLFCSRDDLSQLLARLVVDLADGGTRQYVVELIEEQHLPQPVETFARVLRIAERGHRRERVGLQQPVLGLAVELLDLTLGRERAPVQFQIQFANPDREILLRQPGEEVVHAGHSQSGQRREILQARVVFEHLLARPAPAVAPAEREQRLSLTPLPPEVAPRPEEVEGHDVAVVVHAGVLQGMGHDAAAVEALPLEQVVREVVRLVPRELRGEEPAMPAPRRSCGMPGEKPKASGSQATGLRRPNFSSKWRWP